MISHETKIEYISSARILIQLFTRGCRLTDKTSNNSTFAMWCTTTRLHIWNALSSMWLTLVQNQLRWLNTLKMQHFAVQRVLAHSVLIAILGAHHFATQLLLCIYYLIGLVEIGFVRPCLFSRCFAGVRSKFIIACWAKIGGAFWSTDEPPARRLHYATFFNYVFMKSFFDLILISFEMCN